MRDFSQSGSFRKLSEPTKLYYYYFIIYNEIVHEVQRGTISEARLTVSASFQHYMIHDQGRTRASLVIFPEN